MPHLFYYLDFTVSVFVVHERRVLLVHHRQLEKWLPVGGHIEPGEDPEQAAHRETVEESGLTVELIGEKPAGDFPGTKMLVAPTYLDVHDIQGDHKHLGMIYFARARSDRVRLAEAEHHAIRWFDPGDIDNPEWSIPEAVRFYARDALRRLSCP